jgi:LacI family transcriptional regulator
MRARIVDVAALAGMTPGTASKALNGTGQLRPDTRERVRRAAAQLGFTPDGIRRGLSSGRRHTVGLVTTDSVGSHPRVQWSGQASDPGVSLSGR